MSKSAQSKRPPWDGRFDTSSWVDTGDFVRDAIENGGRLLHEPTSDGGTHEITDRGKYISDDYYFPRNDPGRKPHIHYEIRSTGELLIDGKPIKPEHTKGDNEMRFGYHSSKNRGLDSATLHRESRDQVQEGSRLHELGTRFESDKAKLENELEKVLRSDIPDTDKKRLAAELNNAIDQLQSQYEREVTEEENRVQEELNDKIDSMQESADELAKQAADLRSIRMEASSTDASAAADVAETQQREFSHMRDEYVEQLNRQIQEAEIQQQSIRSRRLGR